MKIGEVAQRFHVSPSIIRYYEGKGLLPRARRDSSGYRVYGEAEVARIEFVTGARQLGFSFADIREVLAVRDAEEAPCPRVLDLITQKVVEVGDRINRLKSIRHELSDLHDLAEAASRGHRLAPLDYEMAE